MQTFSKVVERIVNTPLCIVVKRKGLYSILQNGSLPQRATYDAGIALKHWVQKTQFTKKKVSTMFLDINGGFDHVSHRKLILRLSETEYWNT
jgi:hypothetical protein